MTPQQLLAFQGGDQLLDGIARQVTADSNRIFAKDRSERSTARDARVRLARELHDGILQSLTAAAMQLRVLSQVVDKNPGAASRRIRDIEEMITEEQRDLRLWIDTLKPGGTVSMAPHSDIVAALDKVCRRVEANSGMRIRFMAVACAPAPRTLADETYRLVQEGLSNAARHADAKTCRVDIDISPTRIFLLIADDGGGFAFHGQYDLASLDAEKIGPRSIRERVASLGGQLILTTSASGSSLQIILPMRRRVVPIAGAGAGLEALAAPRRQDGR